MEQDGDKGLRFIRSIAPSASLIRDRHVKKIIKSFTKSLPGCATVAVPIVFMMCMMSILGVDIFGNGQMKRCVNEDDVLSYLGGESCAARFTVFSSD